MLDHNTCRYSYFSLLEGAKVHSQNGWGHCRIDPLDSPLGVCAFELWKDIRSNIRMHMGHLTQMSQEIQISKRIQINQGTHMSNGLQITPEISLRMSR